MRQRAKGISSCTCDLIPRLLALHGDLMVYQTDARIIDVGTPEACAWVV